MTLTGEMFQIQTWRVRRFLRTLASVLSLLRGLCDARFGPRLDWQASKHGFAQLSQLS